MNTTGFSGKTIGEVRQALMGAGFKFAGFAAMTQAETYKRDGQTLFIRRRNGLVVAT
jgi:hypothetical protein